MARPKNEELHQQRREEILLAAARTFKRCGFHAARTEDICTEAGLSSGTVFRHFASKHEMIMEIASREYAFYTSQIQQLATREELEWLSTLDAEKLEQMLTPSEYDLGSDSWLELSRLDPWRGQLTAFESELRRTLAERLVAGQREGWVRADVNGLGAAHLLCAVITGLLFERDIGLTSGRAETARTLAKLCREQLMHT